MNVLISTTPTRFDD